MAKCAICEKGQITGHRISIERSQVSRRANRKWKPNVKKVKIVEDNGNVKFAQDVCVPTRLHAQSNSKRMIKAILFNFKKNGFFSYMEI